MLLSRVSSYYKSGKLTIMTILIFYSMTALSDPAFIFIIASFTEDSFRYNVMHRKTY